jgi:outer membrane protein
MRFALMLLTAFFLLCNTAAQADGKIGFVNTDRVFREAPIALVAQKKLEKEFAPRDADLQKMAKQAKDMQMQLDRDGAAMSDADRLNKERALANANLDYQRKLREFREDLNFRRNEEMVKVQDRARKVIQSYAASEKYDLIVEDAVYFNPKIDITDRIIHLLNQ